MKSQTFVGENVHEIVAGIEKTIKNGLSPTLGIIFASPKLPIAELSKALSSYAIKFIGCTTDGEIATTGAEKVVFTGTAVVCLIEIDPSLFAVGFFEGHKKPSFQAGSIVGEWGKNTFPNPAFLILSSGLHADGEQLLKGLLSAAGSEISVYGGLAGDDRLFKQTLTFTNGEYTDEGVAAIVLDGDKVEVGGIATSGWIGIGAEKRVTKSSGNVVYTVDNEPALNVYKKYLSVDDSELPEVGVDYPLMLFRDDGSSVLRGVMDVDKVEGSLTFAGTVPQGSRVTFSSSSGSDVIEHAKKDLDVYYRSFPHADLLILFSCMARHLSLGPMVDEEIMAAQQMWNVPLVGFFTYGEIGKNVTGQCDFFNETFTLAVLRMK
jgi:hypothetical protein